MAENRRADLGQPSVASDVDVKGSLPRRLSREDDHVSFQHFALPAPQVAQGVPLSRSTTTSGSSSCRGAEDVNWDEMLTASRASHPDTLCGSQRSARSPAVPSPASRHRWEPQLASPILPRPVLSNRPLRRPSSAADKGRLDELLAQAEAVKDEAKMLKRHRRSSAELQPDLKQLVEMFPKFTDTRLKPLSEIFARTNSIRAAREEKRTAAETTAQLEAKLQEAVTFWDASTGCQRKCGVAGPMSPISEKTERTDKATPKSATPKREASLPALLSWSEGLDASEVAETKHEVSGLDSLQVKDLDLPEEMLAPPEASPQRSGHDEEVHLHLEEVPHPKQVPKEDVKPCSAEHAQHLAPTPKTPQEEEISPSSDPKTAASDTPEEPPSPTLKGLLQSMEQDEHFTWLASLGPVRPLTLNETLQDMAMTIASVDAQLLSAHPPSQLEANAQLQQASNRAAEATPPTASPLGSAIGSPESPELHQEEEPREPRAPAATPKSAEIAGELLRKKVKSPILSDTPDTASVISRGSKKEIEEALSQGVGTPDSSTLARFLNRRSPAPSTAGTPRPNLGQRQEQGSRSRVSSEESNAFSDVSFFGQSSICEAHGTVASRGGRGPSGPSAAPRKGGDLLAVRPTAPSAHAAAATPKAMVECALCGRRKGCQPGSCFCIDCSQRMNQIDPASASSDEARPAGPAGISRSRTRGKAAACVICSQPLPGDASDGSVLCPSCLKGQG